MCFLGVFRLGRDLLYWPDAMENFKMIQASEGGQLKSIQAMSAWVFFVWGEIYSIGWTWWTIQKHPSQGGDTVGEEEAKTSKPRKEDHFKSIQARREASSK